MWGSEPLSQHKAEDKRSDTRGTDRDSLGLWDIPSTSSSWSEELEFTCLVQHQLSNHRGRQWTKTMKVILFWPQMLLLID